MVSQWCVVYSLLDEKGKRTVFAIQVSFPHESGFARNHSLFRLAQFCL